MYIFIYRHKIMYSIYIGMCRFSPTSSMTNKCLKSYCTAQFLQNIHNSIFKV